MRTYKHILPSFKLEQFYLPRMGRARSKVTFKFSASGITESSRFIDDGQYVLNIDHLLP